MPRPIRFADVVRLSFQNLMKKKSRSLLVAVGLAIGIAAVVLILNLGRGLTNYVREVFVDNLQSTLLTVSRRSGETFQDEDLTTIADLADVAHVYGSVVIDDATFVFGDVEGDLDALTGYYLYYYPALLHGTMPTDDTGILVNETLAMALGDGAPLAAVGAPIAITVDGVSTTYTVTGIYDDRTASADGANALVTGSALTLLADVAGTADVAYVTVGDVTAIDVVKDDLAQLGFLVVQQENDADSLLSYINLGTKVLSGVGAISMVVAAIMIFIVLYISIVERTKEIGILRAIGARKQDISAMFICEAGIIGIAGGLFAVVFTALITLATNVLTGITLSTTLIAAYVPYYLLGLALSFFVSILAGIAPAVKAAELDPVEALRFE